MPTHKDNISAQIIMIPKASASSASLFSEEEDSQLECEVFVGVDVEPELTVVEPELSVVELELPVVEPELPDPDPELPVVELLVSSQVPAAVTAK